MRDLELWRAWLDGDQAAGNALVRRHFLGIHRFFSRKVGDHADELTQRTFLALVEKPEAYRQQGSLRGYLYGIARKQLLRFFEGRGGRNAEEVARSSLADLGPTPSRVLAAREEELVLMGALERLTIDHQIALELYYWEELSIAEVAEALDVAAGTVKSRLGRARERLRSLLEEAHAAPADRILDEAGIARLDAAEG